MAARTMGKDLAVGGESWREYGSEAEAEAVGCRRRSVSRDDDDDPLCRPRISYCQHDIVTKDSHSSQISYTLTAITWQLDSTCDRDAHIQNVASIRKWDD
jgi:hypothetical protein|uniref:Uncharacterized protein n=1 Tax=Oryza rufipogon TaxID=4529 RepID=A0A0E0MXP4_ORYRU